MKVLEEIIATVSVDVATGVDVTAKVNVTADVDVDILVDRARLVVVDPDVDRETASTSESSK